MTMLEKIIENTKSELRQKMLQHPLSQVRQEAEGLISAPPSFLQALQKDGICIIAEIKKASPSKGLICQDFNPVEIARDYEKGGAAAVSVLTDKKFFQGDLRYLDDVAANVSLPLLRKDFILHEYQIYESRVHHASAILLLAAVLDVMQLTDFAGLAESMGLDVLLEVHNLSELEKALQTPAKFIGVNNRDLKSFTVDLKTSEKLSRYIPREKVKVSESGLNSFAEISQLRKAGFDAFLVGESLMRQNNHVSTLKKLRGL